MGPLNPSTAHRHRSSSDHRDLAAHRQRKRMRGHHQVPGSPRARRHAGGKKATASPPHGSGPRPPEPCCPRRVVRDWREGRRHRRDPRQSWRARRPRTDPPPRPPELCYPRRTVRDLEGGAPPPEGPALELEEAGEGEHVEGDEVGLGAEVLQCWG